MKIIAAVTHQPGAKFAIEQVELQGCHGNRPAVTPSLPGFVIHPEVAVLIAGLCGTVPPEYIFNPGQQFRRLKEQFKQEQKKPLEGSELEDAKARLNAHFGQK